MHPKDKLTEEKEVSKDLNIFPHVSIFENMFFLDWNRSPVGIHCLGSGRKLHASVLLYELGAISPTTHEVLPRGLGSQSLYTHHVRIC